MGICRVEIPLKLPSCNDYINACRYNKYAAAKMKREVEEQICLYINKLPEFKNPIRIQFTWIEKNKRRDLDGICFGKKFILDSLVKAGKITDDNRNCVTGFVDTFSYGKETKVILDIEEVSNSK